MTQDSRHALRSMSRSDYSAALDRLSAAPGDPGCVSMALSGSADPLNACLLFESAGQVRDAHVGRQFQASGVISPIAACAVAPPCAYCPLDNTRLVPPAQVRQALPRLAQIGLRHVYLNGGTRPSGYDADALDVVERAASAGLSPVINFGPSLSRNGLRALRDAGVAAVVASTEIFDPQLFARLKPGERQADRAALMDACEDEGIAFESISIVGVGEPLEDHVRHLCRLRSYRHLRRVVFSRFKPAAGTPMGGHMRCSPWTVARLMAVARLVLPACEIGINMGTDPDELPLWFAAGGSGRIHAVTVSPRDEGYLAAAEGRLVGDDERIRIVDRRPLFAATLAGMNAVLARTAP